MKCQYCGKEQPQTDWKKETLLQMEAMGDNPNDFPYQPSPDKSVEQRAKEYADSILKEPDNAYVSLLVSEIRKAIESSYLAGASDKKGADEINRLRELLRITNAPLIWLSTLDKMPTLGLLDRQGVIDFVVKTAKEKVISPQHKDWVTLGVTDLEIQYEQSKQKV